LNDDESNLTRAVAQRLAKLRTMPVDSARLDVALRRKFLKRQAETNRMQSGFDPFDQSRQDRDFGAGSCDSAQHVRRPVLASAAQMAQVIKIWSLAARRRK